MRRPHQRRLQDRRTERQLWRGAAPADAATLAPADGAQAPPAASAPPRPADAVRPAPVSPLTVPDRARVATWVAATARSEAA